MRIWSSDSLSLYYIVILCDTHTIFWCFVWSLHRLWTFFAILYYLFALPYCWVVLTFRQGSEWPEYQDDGRDKYLREMVAHQELLFHFTKVMVMSDLFRHCADKKPLSAKYTMIRTTLEEACLVLLYYNNYACWYDEWHACAPPGRAKGAGQQKFTNNARGRASTGMALYGRIIVEVVGHQRKEEEKPTLVEFHGKLLRTSRFKSEYGKQPGTSGTRGFEMFITFVRKCRTMRIEMDDC